MSEDPGVFAIPLAASVAAVAVVPPALRLMTALPPAQLWPPASNSSNGGTNHSCANRRFTSSGSARRFTKKFVALRSSVPTGSWSRSKVPTGMRSHTNSRSEEV